MKNKLFLGFSLLSILCFSACSTNNNDNSQADNSDSNSSQNQNVNNSEDARLLKKAATQLIQTSASKAQELNAVKMAWQPAQAVSLAFELKQPAIYFYLAGAMMTNANYDISKAISFRGEYNLDITPGNTMYMDCTIDMFAKLDRDNNKMLFSGYMDSLQGPDKNDTERYTSPLFYEIGFDYATETLKSFKYWQKAGSETIIVFEYDHVNGTGRYYNVLEDDTAEEGTTLRNEYNGRYSTFQTELNTKVVASGEFNRKCCMAFVETQAYVDSVVGQNINLRYIGE